MPNLLLTLTHAPTLKGRVAWGDTVAWGEGGGGSRFTMAWGEAWHPDSSSIAPAMSAWPGALLLTLPLTLLLPLLLPLLYTKIVVKLDSSKATTLRESSAFYSSSFTTSFATIFTTLLRGQVSERPPKLT